MENEKLGGGGGVSPGGFEFFHETRKINYRNYISETPTRGCIKLWFVNLVEPCGTITQQTIHTKKTEKKNNLKNLKKKTFKKISKKIKISKK